MTLHTSSHLLIAALVAFSAITNGTIAQAADVVLAHSNPYVASSDKIQHFQEFVDLHKGQERLNLTLTYVNGSATAPKFDWLRISSSSMNFLTEQSFAGKSTFSENVSGELTWGSNQILIGGRGPKGATFNWTLTTPQPEITGISPTTITPGNTLTITGTNLCPDPVGNTVSIGKTEGKIISASSDTLTVRVPEDCTEGGVVKVEVAGITAVSQHPIKIGLNSQPIMSNVSNAWLPPGYTFTVTGANFGSNPDQTQVYIGPLQCQVTGVTPTTITAITPAAYNGYTWGYYQPIKILIAGTRARGSLQISVAD